MDKRRVKASEVANLLDDLEMRRDAATWKPSEKDEEEMAAACELASAHALMIVARKVEPEDVPPPPRHAEVANTFGEVVENMKVLAEVRWSLGHADCSRRLCSCSAPRGCMWSRRRLPGYLHESIGNILLQHAQNARATRHERDWSTSVPS